MTGAVTALRLVTECVDATLCAQVRVGTGLEIIVFVVRARCMLLTRRAIAAGTLMALSLRAALATTVTLS